MPQRLRRALVVAATLAVASCTHVKMGLFVLKENPRESDPASIPDGKAAFQAHCASCHGEHADGRGPLAAKLAVKPTDFTAPDYVKSATRIAGHIAYGKGDAMPPFVDELPERTIWDIGNYLHSLQQGANAHS